MLLRGQGQEETLVSERWCAGTVQKFTSGEAGPRQGLPVGQDTSTVLTARCCWLCTLAGTAGTWLGRQAALGNTLKLLGFAAGC